MYISRTDNPFTLPSGEVVTERVFIDDWRANKGIPSDARSFQSKLPSENELYGEEGQFSTELATNPTFAARYQLENFDVAVSQAYFNKIVAPSGLSQFSGGTLESFMPEISTVALGTLEAINLGGPNAGMQALDTAMGAAIQALSKIPVVGPILAAVVAVGYMIGKAIAAQAARDRAIRANRENAFYKGLPELPRFSRSADADAMDQVLMAMPSGDWTSLFLPRYDPDKEWVGSMRQMGFAYAPGVRSEWGEATFAPNIYDRTGLPGLGYIPGTQQVTGILQSVISAQTVTSATNWLAATDTSKGKWKRVDTLWEYIQTHGPYVMGQDAVDTGDYFPSSAQVLTQLWGHIQLDGNPDLYRVDTKLVDKQWRRYYEGAWEYTRQMCAWSTYDNAVTGMGVTEAVRKSLRFSGRIKMVESNYACALACLAGVWRCAPADIGGDGVKTYEDMGMQQKFRRDRESRNCSVTFNSFGEKPWQDQNCRSDLYHAHVKETVGDLRDRQWKMLSRSLVCAYVSSNFGAFQGSENEGLRKKLHDMREELLNRPDQWKYLSEADVRRDEVHNGANWYNQLKSAGAFALAAQGPANLKYAGTGGAKPGRLGISEGLEPGSLPPAIDLSGRVPGEESVPEGDGGGAAMIGLAALAALGLAAFRK